jgi:hypothetical protein
VGIDVLNVPRRSWNSPKTTRVLPQRGGYFPEERKVATPPANTMVPVATPPRPGVPRLTETRPRQVLASGNTCAKVS